mmetsp:Transcript_12133/g.37436  ORF Transcript_12133/g.37436 Transcript_12133/m.37436 type:complete len:217 (-) Transcript_12133:502-1152(-)
MPSEPTNLSTPCEDEWQRMSGSACRKAGRPASFWQGKTESAYLHTGTYSRLVASRHEAMVLSLSTSSSAAVRTRGTSARASRPRSVEGSSRPSSRLASAKRTAKPSTMAGMMSSWRVRSVTKPHVCEMPQLRLSMSMSKSSSEATKKGALSTDGHRAFTSLATATSCANSSTWSACTKRLQTYTLMSTHSEMSAPPPKTESASATFGHSSHAPLKR